MKPNAVDIKAAFTHKVYNNLPFIKKHLRYPLTVRQLLRILLSMVVFGIYPFWLLWKYEFGQDRVIHSAFYVMAGLWAVGAITIISAYFHTLRFRAINTALSEAENVKLISDFLLTNQLNAYCLPQHPEVFQIISRPLGSGWGERKEIMVFTAGNGHIIVNSYFTGDKWTLSPQSGNYRKMANRLREWIIIHQPGNDSSLLAG